MWIAGFHQPINTIWTYGFCPIGFCSIGEHYTPLDTTSFCGRTFEAHFCQNLPHLQSQVDTSQWDAAQLRTRQRFLCDRYVINMKSNNTSTFLDFEQALWYLVIVVQYQWISTGFRGEPKKMQYTSSERAPQFSLLLNAFHNTFLWLRYYFCSSDWHQFSLVILPEHWFESFIPSIKITFD